MRRIIGFIAATLIVIIVALSQAPTQAADHQPRLFRACQTEDSIRCVWDARHQGNGEGASLVVDGQGTIKRVRHSVAHALQAARGDWQRVPERLVGVRVEQLGGGSFVVGPRARIAYGGTTYIKARGYRIASS